MKFGQPKVNRIQHEKYFFLKSHTQNIVGNLVLESFLRNQIENISRSTVIKFVFIVYRR